MQKIYVQYGCGLSCPEGWINYDASPTLRLQQLPLVGSLFKRFANTIFPNEVVYGDIIKGLPIAENSCSGVYCSHTLEHLSFNDCKLALKHTLKILQPNGVFRCVVPDLETAARQYILALENGQIDAGNEFIRQTLLGIENRPKGIKKLFISYFGNAHHLWMWDKYSLAEEIKKAGFSSVRFCDFDDAADPYFKLVEDKGRFTSAVAIEAVK